MNMIEMIEREFDIYVRWFELSLDIIWHLTPDAKAKYDPLSALRDVISKPTKQQVKGLSQAIKDTVGMTDRHSAAEIADLDATFLAAGLPQLTTLRVAYSSNVAKILRREHIETEEDYYLLKSLEDLDVPDKIKDRARLLYGKYEIDHM